MKQAGLALSDPTNTAPENWMASYVITGHLVTTLRVQEEFRMANHSTYLIEGREEVSKRNVKRSREALAETQEGAPVQDACRL